MAKRAAKDRVRWGVISTARIGWEKVLPGMMKSKELEIRAIASRSLPNAKPYVSFTRTTFLLGQPPSSAVEVGSPLTLGVAEVKAAYEYYKQSGSPSQGFFTLGVDVRF